MPDGRAVATRGAILLVEDDEALSSIVRRHLVARGYSVELAESAEDAATLLRSGLRPGLVLLDINLPGDTGWALARGGLLEQAGSPAVVVVSATRIPPARLREYGFAGYLPKPFALETLLTTIDRLLNHGEGNGDT